MTHARAWRVLAFCGCCAGASCSLLQTARAAPSSARAADPAPPLARVEVATSGDVERDPVLFERIRSLFPSETAVELSDDHRLDQRAVLRPERADTVYVWIRVTDLSDARVYLALAEPGQSARYLYREIKLDSGLDEVGAETLAEVAHSSARALWLREQQSPRETLLSALEKETPPPSATPPPAAVAPAPVAVVKPVAAPHDSPEVAQRSGSRTERAALRLGAGLSGTTHSSGSEGFLQEIGAFLGAEFRGRLSLRAAVRYLVPTDFGVPPARVHLTGGSGELRAGWLSHDVSQWHVRLEAGLGALLGHAQPSIIEDEPMAHALAAQGFQRAYALAAAGFEWPIGPAWVAAGLDLRVPLAKTSYEVGGQAGAITSASLCPGGSLEVGFGFDPAPR